MPPSTEGVRNCGVLDSSRPLSQPGSWVLSGDGICGASFDDASRPCCLPPLEDGELAPRLWRVEEGGKGKGEGGRRRGETKDIKKLRISAIECIPYFF